MSKISNIGLGDRSCASLWTLRVAAVAKAYCIASVNSPFCTSSHAGNGVAGVQQWQIKPGEPPAVDGGLAEFSAAKEPAGARNFIAFGKAMGGKAIQN